MMLPICVENQSMLRLAIEIQMPPRRTRTCCLCVAVMHTYSLQQHLVRTSLQPYLLTLNLYILQCA